MTEKKPSPPGTETGEIVVSVRDLWFGYDREPVLIGVNMDVRQHDFLAVIGPNGGGKTTLLRLILGMLEPSKGRIDILDGPPRAAIRKIGYVAQNTAVNLTFPVSVGDVVCMGRLGADDGESDNEMVGRALERVGMTRFAERKIGALSGGQRQRVLLARALATNPEIMILDEPTANIDTEGQIQVYELLHELNRDHTLIVAGHDLTGLMASATRIAYVNRELHVHETPGVDGDMGDIPGISALERLCPVGVLDRILAAGAGKDRI